MTRGRIAVTAVGVLTVAAVVVLVGVVARGWWRGEGGAYAPVRTLVRTQVSPARSLFGQVLTAQAEVIVDPRLVDPASVDLKADLRPFRIRSAVRRVVDGPGRSVIVDFRYAIQCISRACVPRGLAGRARGAATAEQLNPAQATARERDGHALELRVAWPVFGVQSRLTADEIAFSTPQAAATLTPTPVSWAISPNLLGAFALGGAALLLLGAGWLVASVVRGDTRAFRGPRIPSHLTPIERALALAEHAAAHGEVAESRKALERLAVELRRRRAVVEAGSAERLAWSERGPSPETVAELAEEVRSNGAR
ncbi:MAG: hypothetical protein HOQ28_10285 [Thermoleophilia bacterium]|nr:hypothetical protein [Thermoleophilia bacterium]